MLTRLRQLFSRERDLRMIWEIEKRERKSYLVGSTHFFSYHFRSSLRRYISEAEVVLLEGPLDDQAMRKVIQSGSGDEHTSLLDALDAATVHKISAALGDIPPLFSGYELYQDFLIGDLDAPLKAEIKGMKPWMAFLHIWNRYRAPNGWAYSMDLDAARIAAELGKEVHPLETIEEQIDALDGIPLERIVSFLRNVDWSNYATEYVQHYVEGDLESLIAGARSFPTFCESIVDRRDPVLFARMSPYFERGGAIAFVGVLHCHGLIPMFRALGFGVNPVSRGTEVRRNP